MDHKLLLLAPLLIVGCSEAEFDPTDPNATLTACTVVERIFEPKCNDCHEPGGDYPDLSMAGLGALIGVESEGYPGQIQVVPGDPEASFLYRKIAGTLTPEEGDPMPEKKPLPAATVEFVARWIREGANMDCAPGTSTSTTDARYHAEGYAEATVHGYELELGLEADCRQCHGQALEGEDDAPDCDSCHQAGWRDDCTYCHGGVDDDSGAPPRDLAGVRELALASFKAHTPHGTEANHAAYACGECHVEPTDVLSVGHIFDDETAGVAEVVFAGGLSRQGQYDGNGACSNLYCHGSGRVTGAASHDDAKPDCNACHAGPTAVSAWATLSGQHRKHMRERVACTDCHAGTVSAANTIIGPLLHVDGDEDVDFGDNAVTRTNARCTGTCHNERHTNETW